MTAKKRQNAASERDQAKLTMADSFMSSAEWFIFAREFSAAGDPNG